jgi:hypothetical protein
LLVFEQLDDQRTGRLLAVLLKGFFAFYEQFDFRSSIVTLLNRETRLKSTFVQWTKDKDWPIFIENPLVPLMNASKNLVESEGDRFRATCTKANEVLSEPSASLQSLFEQCRQTVPDDLVGRAYPAPVDIMPDLDTDIDHGESAPVDVTPLERINADHRN